MNIVKNDSIPHVPYVGGTVESYDDRMGYGYILPDDAEAPNERLLVHRKSLRGTNLALQSGDRVLYKIEFVPRGKLASDVHLELESATNLDTGDVLQGVITQLNPERGFGFIDTPEFKRVFFHFSNLANEDVGPTIGMPVTFRPMRTERGLHATDVSIDAIAVPLVQPVVKRSVAIDYLAQAILARDNRKLSDAAALYEKGMHEFPSVQLVTSYAAMEKNRNKRSAAMRIYEAGIHIFPQNVKLREDAGLLAASAGQSAKAIDMLKQALQLSREKHQTSTSVLLALARIYARRGGGRDLAKGLEYFSEAQRILENRKQGRGSLSRDDLLTMNLSQIRLQHHRGQLVFDFINDAGFKIIRANLLEQTTVGADIVIEIKNPEIVESYGISGNVLIRCFFKSDVMRSDLETLDAVINEWSASGLVDEQLAFIVVSDLPDNLQRTLFRRIEDRKRLAPTIVPFTQSIIETSKGPLATIRTILDQWLYRRDLFSLNFPVVGQSFYGRDKILAETRDAIAHSLPTGIFGLRKVGKTSLLKEIARRSGEGGDVVVFMDLLRVPADISDTRWLYWKLATEIKDKSHRARVQGLVWRLGGQFKDFFDIPKDFPVATAFDADLTQLLKAIKASSINPKPKVVLLFDEIERIVPNKLGKEGFQGFFDFFGYLRGVCQESDDFVILIAGANAAVAEAAQFEGKDNPVFNFFGETYLQFLQPQECERMITTLGRGMGLRFSQQTCDCIYQLAGGHPFFTRQFCSFLAERSKDRPFDVTVPFVKQLVDPYLEFAGKDFQEIIDRFTRDYPIEKALCIALARAGGHMEIKNITNGLTPGELSIRHLVGYQIVQISDGGIKFTMDLMTKWLQRGLVDVVA